MNVFIDLTGLRVGMLSVIRRESNLGKSPRWLCQCDCGQTSVVHSSALRKKNKPTDNCGCLTYQKVSKAITTHGLSNTYIIHMYDSAKARAKKKGLDFNIEVSDIKIPSSCPYLGIPIIHSKGVQTANSPSLDRINPSLGYIKGNVEVISYRANAIKHNASFEEFEKMYLSWKKRQDRE